MDFLPDESEPEWDIYIPRIQDPANSLYLDIKMGDGKFGYRQGLAVVQIVLFPISLYFAVRFGLERKHGWFCIGFFSFFRIASGSCILAMINNNSETLLLVSLVCESIGILLMIFLLFELSERVYACSSFSSIFVGMELTRFIGTNISK